jgi:hypothetical protein
MGPRLNIVFVVSELRREVQAILDASVSILGPAARSPSELCVSPDGLRFECRTWSSVDVDDLGLWNSSGGLWVYFPSPEVPHTSLNVELGGACGLLSYSLSQDEAPAKADLIADAARMWRALAAVGQPLLMGAGFELSSPDISSCGDDAIASVQLDGMLELLVVKEGQRLPREVGRLDVRKPSAGLDIYFSSGNWAI